MIVSSLPCVFSYERAVIKMSHSIIFFSIIVNDKYEEKKIIKGATSVRTTCKKIDPFSLHD